MVLAKEYVKMKSLMFCGILYCSSRRWVRAVAGGAVARLTPAPRKQSEPFCYSVTLVPEALSTPRSRHHLLNL